MVLCFLCCWVWRTFTDRGVVRPAFRMAVEDDLIKKNPFDWELATVLINDSIKREAVTPRQERLFLDFIKGDDFPAFILFLMIVGAVVTALLRWIDINKKIKEEKKWKTYTRK